MEIDKINDAQLAALESDVTHAARTDDLSALNVVGFGEMSVALGYPAQNPTAVCKRIAIFSPAQLAAYRELVSTYIDRLRAAQVQVVLTEVRGTLRPTGIAGYLVQPYLDHTAIGDEVLRASAPDPEHPLLVAIAQMLDAVSPTLSIDAQITNWSWDGSTAWLIDVGTPFMWDDHGRLLLDPRPMSLLFPAVLRRKVVGDLRAYATRWTDPVRVAQDLVANLYRVDLADWVDPAITTLNAKLGDPRAVTRDNARALLEQDRKELPVLKRIQRTERFWQTRVRRRTYDYLITESTVVA